MKHEGPVCKNLLCIRPDNMGDLIMTSPALLALKQTLKCSLTLLTSSMAAPVTPFIDAIDEVIIYDFPWVKNDAAPIALSYERLLKNIRNKNFDAAIIFTVYSQNPLPCAMLAWQAGIPIRAAWCRENPYALLTHWLPDKEPYVFIQHQVLRDCKLAEAMGAVISDTRLKLQVKEEKWQPLKARLLQAGANEQQAWVVVHTAVSEGKRKYPETEWIKISRGLIEQTGCNVFYTGGSSDAPQLEVLAAKTGIQAISLAGKISVEELILLVKNSRLVITVNTVTMHIAAATNTPVIALYALTNPQHYPWKAHGHVFTFGVDTCLQSKNEVIRFASQKYFAGKAPATVSAALVVTSAVSMLNNAHAEAIPEMDLPPAFHEQYSKT